MTNQNTKAASKPKTGRPKKIKEDVKEDSNVVE